MTTPWYKSKQFWFNVLAVVITIATAFDFDTFTPDPRIMVIAQALIAVINVVLRFAIPSKPYEPPPLASGMKAAIALEDHDAKTRHDNQTAAIVYTGFAFAAMIGIALGW